VLTERPAAGDAASAAGRSAAGDAASASEPTRSVEVCGGHGGRKRQVYVSTGNVVEISVDVRRDSPDYFVLLYEGQMLHKCPA